MQRLNNKIGDDASIVFEHAWTISVEDARDANVYFVLPVIVSHQRFREPLAFVVTGAQADRVDVAPVVFSLRVDQRIAVNFRSRSLKNAGAYTLGEPKHVDGAHYARLYCFHRIVLIMQR